MSAARIETPSSRSCDSVCAPPAPAGYLRALGWPHGGGIEILQGQEMGMPSLLRAEIPPGAGMGIRVSDAARLSADTLPLPH
ncbi:hypothetical protein [Neoroseomonas rubea]|uniref:hypothetical protein n=1 Tax=Neoroseomonas rubea TaxID=2748666 RepID=UPI0018DF667A|nr:hypothetical protein [Roseomonas rubea]